MKVVVDTNVVTPDSFGSLLSELAALLALPRDECPRSMADMVAEALCIAVPWFAAPLAAIQAALRFGCFLSQASKRFQQRVGQAG
mgnify:CR=1 FL=1